MVMELERHNEILRKLNDPETSHSERADLVLELQNDYTSVRTEVSTSQEKLTALEKEKYDLLEANSKYYRQLQTQSTGTEDDLTPKHEEPVKITDLFD